MGNMTEELGEEVTIKDSLIVQIEGKISHDDAVRKAEDIYAEFRIRQDELYISEFDRDMAKYLKGGKDDE